MCGINGFITYNDPKQKGLVEGIHKMNDLIFHRGPDDDGAFTEVHQNFGIAMGMRRLSIIDLTTGKQPIYSDKGNLVIVFNGEIYNYPRLREELIQKGVNFQTHSDTEVILKLYEQEDTQAFHKLDGMFAFSIYDKRKGKVIIARDFFGEKPLYFSTLNNGFIWASELKSLVEQLPLQPEISTPGLNHFLRLTYIPAPHTIYDNVFKLEANHYLEYDIQNRSFTTERIEEEFSKDTGQPNFETAKKRVGQIVRESVESRSISDVPIGTFLSGGVDSSIVSLCLAQSKDSQINTFSIGFKKKEFSETDKSRLVAKLINSKHHEFIIGEEDLKHNIHEILLNFDEPFSDTASLPNYLVSKKTSEHVKVALTGDGGDEVFGGYTKYYAGRMNSRYTSIVPQSVHKWILKDVYPWLKDRDDKRGMKFRVRKMLNSVNYDGGHYWDIISLGNTDKQLNELLNKELIVSNLFDHYKKKLNIQRPNNLTDYRFIDKIVSLEGGMLAKVDRTSMLTSLECRAPFLNKKLWAYANSLPEHYLIKGWDKKYILKAAFKDQFPEKFLDRSKQGFGSPVGDWLRSGLRSELESYIEKKFLESQGLFNMDFIIPLVKSHLSGKEDHTFQVWAYYCFQKWYINSYLKK